MKLHEHQAKALLAARGVPVPRGVVAASAAEAGAAFDQLGGGRVVIKAQVHSGGRGKAGGVKLAATRAEAVAAAAAILGMTLRTAQTGPAGVTVHRVLLEQASTYQRELYAAALVDRGARLPVLLLCPQGGMEIERLAVEQPELIRRLPVHPLTGLQGFQVRDAATFLGLGKEGRERLGGLLKGLLATLWDCDASLVEINPLVVTADERLIALDAKLTLDDAALFRHPDLAALDDPSQADAREVRAAQADLSYVALDGSIGCLVNGAGLAMATMDLIKASGGMPANFLDIGGGATKERVAEALRIISADDKVKAILVNIFGGIVRCDVVAEGIVAAARELSLRLPLVVRLEGTNAAQGREILQGAQMSIIAASTLDEAAAKAVAAAG